MNGSGASETVFRAIEVGTSYYNYYYDGRGHRWQKAYPAGDPDEYFYAGDQLIEDQGNFAQTFNPGEKHYHPIDDYVWLGGRAVAIVHGALDPTYRRMADDDVFCSRERDNTVCGTYFPITDHLGKPVLMLDGNQKVAGVGEYEPYGQVNRVSLDAETTHTQAFSSGATTIRALTQPKVAGLNEDVRVHLVDFDPSCASNGNTVLGYAQVTTPGYSWTWGACHLGDYWFPWLPSSNGTLNLNVQASSSVTMWGAIWDGYEYRRYQTGATPFWTPLRFPGQYHDEETDLNQNWNRFYDPVKPGYLEPEPMWQTPVAALAGIYGGVQWPVYGYAANNPLAFSDRTGTHIFRNVTWSDAFDQPEDADSAAVTGLTGGGPTDPCSQRPDGWGV